MAVEVVEQLEAVQIQIGHRQPSAGGQLSLQSGQRLFDPAAIQHPRQRVVERHETQVLVQARLLGDVLDQALDLTSGQGGPDRETVSGRSDELQLGARLVAQTFHQGLPAAARKMRGPGRQEVTLALSEHASQRRVGLDEAPLLVGAEQADRHRFVGRLQAALGLAAVVALLLHLRGHRQRGEQTREQRGRDAVDHLGQSAHAQPGRDHLREAGEQGDGEGSGVPQGHLGARQPQDAQQVGRHQQHTAGSGQPNHRQELSERQQQGQQQQRRAAPGHQAQRPQRTQVAQLVAEEIAEQRVGADEVQRHRQQAHLPEPGARHMLTEPLEIGACRQRGHAQVQQHPAGKQHIGAVAVDQPGDEEEQTQHDQAAVEPAGLAVVALDQRVQLVLAARRHRDVRRAEEFGAAQQSVLQSGGRQCQRKAGPHRSPRTAGPIAIDLTQRLPVAPATHARGVARWEFQPTGVGGHGVAVHTDPERVCGAVRAALQLGRGAGQFFRSLLGSPAAGLVGHAAEHQGVVRRSGVLAGPAGQRPDRQPQQQDRQHVGDQPIDEPIGGAVADYP